MKKILIGIVLLVVVWGAFWAKGYYNSRYVISNTYYTQVPTDEVNEESWLVNKEGVKQVQGKEYDLIGYDENGNEKEVYFSIQGTAKDYYAPGTYIKIDSSETITLGQSVIEKQDIPAKALEKIEQKGTKVIVS